MTQTFDYTLNEEETKTEYIDPLLRSLGWKTEGSVRLRKEYPITKGRLIGNGKREKPLKADYILQYKNRSLAVIEAKAIHKYYTEGVGQAKDYAERLKIRFAYATNGDQIYFIDMETGEEKEVFTYPTPDELWEMTFPKKEEPQTVAENWIEKFYQIPFNDRGGTWAPRYYQENAVNAVLSAIAENKQRILLTLATGTGKTAIAFQISWKLFQTKWNNSKDPNRRPRILFLADRNNLADQAYNAFSAFDEDARVRIEPEGIRKKGHVPKNGSIFFTIFQTFMSGPGDTPYFGEYPKDFFDLIIIDECHRGGANDESSWREILEYFSSAVQLGLTATPKRTENVNTYEYFGEPVYIYSLKEGINDGFLTPFRVKEISTTLDEYRYVTGDTVLSGKVEENKTYYHTKDYNKKIIIEQYDEYRVKLLMRLINQNQKTLVFCANQPHALKIRDLINQYADSKDPNYCHRVTADDGDIGEQHLKEFRDNERTIPTVLTTSHKLSTGVDAQNIRNIVLFRPLGDPEDGGKTGMVEFKQIIGRGTRLFEGKNYFTLYDFVGAHKFFKDPDWDGDEIIIDDGWGKSGEDKTPKDRPPREIEYKPPIRIKLSDSRVREIDSMVSTSFYSPAGAPISAEEFIKQLFGDIPSLFKDEAELRKIWGRPDTRKDLLTKLGKMGYPEPQLEELTELVHGEDSDLFDVLLYIAYSKPLTTRDVRAALAKTKLDNYSSKQKEFLHFVLEQYVSEGVKELDSAKLSELIRLKYHALADGLTELGGASSAKELFSGFQQHLYTEA